MRWVIHLKSLLFGSFVYCFVGQGCMRGYYYGREKGVNRIGIGVFIAWFTAFFFIGLLLA